MVVSPSWTNFPVHNRVNSSTRRSKTPLTILVLAWSFRQPVPSGSRSTLPRNRKRSIRAGGCRVTGNAELDSYTASRRTRGHQWTTTSMHPSLPLVYNSTREFHGGGVMNAPRGKFIRDTSESIRAFSKGYAVRVISRLWLRRSERRSVFDLQVVGQSAIRALDRVCW